MNSIAVLVVEKGRARVMRFRVELSGEASWSLDFHTVPEAIKKLRPDLLTVVENEEQARWLAGELRRQGRADAVILLHPDPTPSAPGQMHVALSKPTDLSNPKELILRLADALLASQGKIPVSPLSGLPGAFALREDVERRMAAKEKFIFLYLDLDNFKAYNDYYGFAKGDEVIALLGGLVKQICRECGGSSDLCVHIGGDDFGIITHPARAEEIARGLIKVFDEKIPSLYQEPERSKGFIVTQDRRGVETTFPLISLSIAGVSNERREISSYPQLSEIAAEIKSFAKQECGSVFLMDRRDDKRQMKRAAG
jgi:GGDEF domain-containing protein